MSDEHGWPELHDPGHHDDPGHHGYDHDDDGAHAAHDPGEGWHDDVAGAGHDDLDAMDHGWEHPDPAVHEAHEVHEVPDVHDAHDVQQGADGHAVVDVTHGHELGPVGADPDAAADPGDLGDDPAGVFPPSLDVGPLPEPVDGFPWIDTGSLGAVDPHAVPADPVTAADLAGYAAEELPPAQDPWAHLAQSEDPATSALARWWRDNG
ncbi:hypothetical protein COUCH_21120 [Couchioplanes caeruleus]|uniref:hypothetical protein n=1 Tax=Couchioplanes caeruleus TaxID=56438 RepID=UPI0020BE1B68|nr:hypothetical protein [Couchioplanes caeruleus]UQU68785.1 hypothetical protein COUCH_21120 [Couchioplanes caeruleus]